MNESSPKIRYLSQLVFQWLGPFLAVGFSRPLEKEDFWELPKERLTETISTEVENNFYKRCPPEKRPRHMRAPDDIPTTQDHAKPAPVEQTLDEKIIIDEHTDLQPPVETLTAVSTQTAVPPEAELEAGLPGSTSKATPASGWSCFRRKSKPQYDESLAKAIHRTFFTQIWTAGALKLFSGASIFVLL
jgi:ATP-binding cassette subfamily C (CFTR/MRP) protein 1